MAKKHTTTIRLTQEALGTCPGDDEVYASFIASKAPDAATTEEEVAAFGVDEVTQKGMTVFQADEEGHPYLYNYMIRGFYKSAAAACKKITGTKTNKDNLKAHKKAVDNWIPVFPRKLFFTHEDGTLVEKAELGNCQRPLRAQTAQGERVSLASSVTVPAGTYLTFETWVLDESLDKYIREWLSFGRINGLCQWRNSGKGSFVVVSDTVEDVPYENIPDEVLQ